MDRRADADRHRSRSCSASWSQASAWASSPCIGPVCEIGGGPGERRGPPCWLRCQRWSIDVESGRLVAAATGLPGRARCGPGPRDRRSARRPRASAGAAGGGAAVYLTPVMCARLVREIGGGPGDAVYRPVRGAPLAPRLAPTRRWSTSRASWPGSRARTGRVGLDAWQRWSSTWSNRRSMSAWCVIREPRQPAGRRLSPSSPGGSVSCGIHPSHPQRP